IPDFYKCINGNQPFHLVIDIDIRQKPDPSDLKLPSLDNEKINHYRELESFTEIVMELVGKPYAKFIDRLAEEKYQSIDDDNALVKGANLVIANYRDFILKCYRQKQYKPDHKNLSFGKVLDKVESKEKSKNINIKEIEDALDAFSDFLSEEPSTTLICSTVDTGKTKTLRKILTSLAQSSANLPCTIWISYHKTLSNESKAKLKELEKFDFKVRQYQNIVADLKTCKWDLIIVQVKSILHLDFQEGCSCIAILNKANTTICQMASEVHARESFNAMHNLLNVATRVVAMDAFANDSTLAFLKSY
ncbi:6149_t:CDS:2, partial [Cetraspora pellucida]